MDGLPGSPHGDGGSVVFLGIEPIIAFRMRVDLEYNECGGAGRIC
jgi:hypothetical protein